MMDLFATLGEQRIREAQQRGEFDDLPGAGQPLDLTDDPLVPEELRVAYRMLKNAGFVPPELEAHSEMRAVEQLLDHVTDKDERGRLVTRISFLLARMGRLHRSLRAEEDYLGKLGERLSARRASRG